jgi:WhiB family redox-sensing transcriptional regulator
MARHGDRGGGVNGPTPGAVTGTTSYRAGSDLSWQERGACRTADPELFFAPDGERANSNDRNERQAAAKAVCGGCPVLLECRRYGLDNRESYGIWGGLDEDERGAVHAERSPAQPANSSGAWRAGQEAANVARRAQAEQVRAALAADVEHLADMGADLHAVARATGRTTKALQRALQRAQRHDLIARLKKAA